MSKLQVSFHHWSSVGFLSVSTDRIVLIVRKSRSLARVRSIATLPEIDLIYVFAIIGLAGGDVL